MASGFGQKIEDMSIEELEAALDRLTKASRLDSNPETQRYREDEIARLSRELHRKRGTKNIDMVLEEEREQVGF